MKIDFRSDTVTKPTPAMLDAMMQAEVGDDVFGEDLTIRKLESKCAGLFGMEAGLYCPSGTMTNQIGINVLSNPYEEVICYQGSHIYKYEGGGVAGNSGLSFRLLEGDRGRISVSDVLENINNPEDIHLPISSIVALENTVNKGGGSCYELSDIAQISEASRSRGLKIHLDGARVFNAIVANAEDSTEYGKHFDTISVCLSKGLGAPVGSVLLGSKEIITKALRVRKAFGGGMRQAGYLAAAGIYALDHHVDRLEEDHKRAKVLADELSNMWYVDEVLPAQTNIVIFKLSEGLTTDHILRKFADNGLLAVPFGPGQIRLVTHLDIDDDMMEEAIQIIRSIDKG